MQHNQTSHAAIAAEVGLSATAALRTRLSLFPGRVSLEVGIAHSGPLTSGYAGVAYGTLGTTVNVRLSRAGHSVHLPLHLSDHYQDWRTLLLAVTLPLAVNILSTQCVPLPPTLYLFLYLALSRFCEPYSFAPLSRHAFRSSVLQS